MRWILFSEVEDIGGKARALAALSRAGLPVPAWFVVRSAACLHSLGETAARQLAAASEPGAIQQLLASALPDAELAAELKEALAELSLDKGLVAVRSSASDEDGSEHSFAGQLESYLSVAPEQVCQKVADVWRSGFSESILAYRRQHRLSLAPRPPAVLVQRMVDADAAGVAFSADPVSGRRGLVVVSAVRGLGNSLVSGEVNGDTWRVNRAGNIVERHCPAMTGQTPAATPVLTDDQVRAIAALARRCAAHFGRPQDIEWAIEGGQVYLLQSRPITSLSGMGDPDGVLNIWDNSNIAESYGGITTPLTYSFARRIYEEVYRQFCRIMAVPPARIADNAAVFRCMLGLVRGRVYYNLLNWYRVLAMLPGFTVNRHFMEQMMEVKEGLPEELLSTFQPASAADRLKDGLNLALTVGKLVVNHFTLPRRIDHFYARLNHALRPPDPPLEQARPDELVGYYEALERQLLTRWDAPIVNDFFAMIFYGLLRNLATKWCGDADGTLQNNLLCGEGGIISAEPAKRVRELAEILARHPHAPARLLSVPDSSGCESAPFSGEGDQSRLTSAATISEMLQVLEQVPKFMEAYQAYLDKFGDRCLDELKLESPTLHDDPTMLLRSIAHLAIRLRGGDSLSPRVSAENSPGDKLSPPRSPEPSSVCRSRREEAILSQEDRHRQKPPHVGSYNSQAPTQTRDKENTSIETELRRKAEARVEAALRHHWLRRAVFRWVLKHARARVRERENLRFERTRLFGRVRRIFVALGQEFHARNLLDSPKDIFYLELTEITGFCHGTVTTADLKALVALRRAEFERYAKMPPPADRFETRGPVHHGNAFQPAAPKANSAPASADQWQGIGCCPGIVRGPVRVITDPRQAVLKPGEILVAERTDPGWIMLFASAAGLLVERGSLLSHSAIVSREMGLASIVSIPAITRRLKDGDMVEMDGSTGIVKRIRHD